jgi:hypothetical protein
MQVERLQQVREKQLDLSHFFGEPAYITIKRLSRDTKQKIQLFSAGSISTKFSQFITAGLEKGDIDPEKMADDESIKEQLLKMAQTMTPEELEQSQETLYTVDELYLLNCVDQEKHNFTDKDGNLVKIDKYFFSELIPGEVVQFILCEIKSFNKTSALVELKGQRSGTL